MQLLGFDARRRHSAGPEHTRHVLSAEDLAAGEVSTGNNTADRSAPDDLDLGARLREIRKSRGLSQRQLAQRSGVAHGLVSMIEQNRSSPSVASLKKVLDALGVSFADFFTPTDCKPDQVFFRADEFHEISPERLRVIGSAGPVGPISLRQIGDGSSALQIIHERYPPGADTGEEMLSHESEEGGIVISGQIELTVSGQTRSLRAGDGFLFDSRLPHRYRNASNNEECVLVCICTPPSF